MDKINKLREIINSSKRIVFFSGAGVSTGSGILTLDPMRDYITKRLPFLPRLF